MKGFIVILLLMSSQSWAASCCGGSFSFPALILGDDKAQVTGTFSYSQVTADVLSNGKWLRRNDDNRTQTFKMEGALLLNESWQTGFTLPLLSKDSNSTPESQGVGDAAVYLGHETFPERSYSRWKPRGVTFLQLNLPTSPSIYDSNTMNSSDIRGRGFTALGAGLALTKAWLIWDFNFSGEIHKSFERTADGSSYGGKATVTPGWGTTQSVGLGWNKKDFRLGGSLTFLFEEPVKISGSTSSEGQAQKNFTLGFSGSYMISMESAVTLNYSDQSWIGNPVNSSLSNTLNLSYQQRWPR